MQQEKEKNVFRRIFKKKKSTEENSSPQQQEQEQQKRDQQQQKKQQKLQKRVSYVHQNRFYVLSVAIVLVALFGFRFSGRDMRITKYQLPSDQRRDPNKQNLQLEFNYHKLLQLEQQGLIHPNQTEEIWKYLVKSHLKEDTLSSDPSTGKLFTIMSIVYGIGSLVLSASALTLIYVFWHSGTAITTCSFIYFLLFYAAARVLISSTTSSYIGGLLYIGSISLAPVILLGIMKTFGIWNFAPIEIPQEGLSELSGVAGLVWRATDVGQMVAVLGYCGFRTLYHVRKVLPEDFLRLSLVLQASVLGVALIAYAHCTFPLVQIVIITTMLFFTITLVEVSPLAAMMATRNLSPSWMFVAGINGLCCTIYAVCTSSGFSFGASIVGSLLLLFTMPFFCCSILSKGQVNLTPKEMLAIFKRTGTHPQTETAIKVVVGYHMANLALLFISIRLRLWAFAPSGLLGVFFSILYAPAFHPWVLKSYHVVLSLILLCFTRAFEDATFERQTEFLEWFGDANYMQCLINFVIRFCATFLATSMIAEADYRIFESIQSIRSDEEEVVFVFFSTAINEAIGAFAKHEESYTLSLLLHGVSAQIFFFTVFSLFYLGEPIQIFRLQRIGTDFVALALSIHMLVLSGNCENTVGYVLSLLAICFTFVEDIRSGGNRTLSREHRCLCGVSVCIKSFLCICFATLGNARALVVIGIGSIYVLIARILIRESNNIVENMLIITVMGAATIQFGVSFQQYYDGIESIVLLLSPEVLTNMLAKASTEKSDEAHLLFPAIEFFTQWLRGNTL